MEHIKILKDVAAMANRQYVSFGDYSVTDLITPPRIVRLRKRYGSVVQQTLRSQIASIMGSGIHGIFEDMLRLASVVDNKYMLERSVTDVFEVKGLEDYGSRLVAGRFDILYDQKHITDIKTANVWKTVFDPKMVDWHAQQNLYAYLLHRRGFDIQTINILAIYKDWKAGDALRDRSYPQEQVVEYTLNLWPWEQTEKFLLEKLSTHMTNEQAEDDDLPACTRDERWERHPKGVSVMYACMKNDKSKRAVRVFTTMNDAKEYMLTSKTMGADSFVEVRYAKRKRCEDFCAVNQYCNHYLQYAEQVKKGVLNEKISYGDL